MGKKGTIHFTGTMDNDQVIRKLREQRKGIIDSGKTAKEQGEKIENSNKKITKSITPVVSATKKQRQEIEKSKKSVEGYSDKVKDLLGLNTEFGSSLIGLGKSGGGANVMLQQMGVGIKAVGKTLLGLMLNPAFLVIAGIAGVGAAFKFWFDYNKGLIEATKLTKQFTGLGGNDLKAYRNEVQALSDTFNKDFKEVLMASNSVSKQFGITQGEALRLIKDGFIAGADANGEYIETLKEYPTFFKEMGISASEFIAITTQTNKSGIYSDKGVDAIKEASLRIREMTPAAKEALDNIGLSGNQIQKDLTSGTKTVFDVIKEVSTKLNELPANSKVVGTAIADIFGGAGEDAGLQYLKTIKDIDTNLNNVKKSAGELGKLQEEQLRSKADLNNTISALFDQTGGTFEKMTTGVKVFVNDGLNSMLKGLVNVINYFIELYNESSTFVSVISFIGFAFQSAVKVSLIPLKLLYESISSIGPMMKAAFTGDWKGLKKAAVNGANSFVAVFKDAGTEIKEDFEKAMADTSKRKKIKPIIIPVITETSEKTKNRTLLTPINANREKDKSDEEVEAKKQQLDELLEKYRSYEQQRTAINKKYDAQRKDIENSNISQPEKDSYISEINKTEERETSSVNDAEYTSLQKDGGIIAEIFNTTANKSISDINSIRDEAQELLAYLANTKPEDIVAKFGMSANQLIHLRGSADELDKIKSALDQLHTEGVQKNPFAQMAKDIENVFKAGKEGGDLNTALVNLGKSAGDSASKIGGLAGGLSDIFAEAGNEKMAGVASGVEMAMTSVSNVASGFANGGIVGGIAAAAGELLNYATMAFKAEGVHQAALEAVNQSKIEQQKEYNSLLREQNLLFEQGNTVFGSDAYGKANNAIKQSKLDSNAINEQMAKIAGVEVVTGHEKTGLFGWGKGRDTYSNISGELIDSEGKLNVERAKSILATQTMSDEHRKAIEDGIELTEKYEESVTIMNDYLTSIFGDMGNAMSDALVDAFRNGTDAGEGFANAMTGMLENMAQDFAYSMALAPILAEAQKEIDALNRNTSLSEKERALAIQELMMNTGKNLAEGGDEFQKYLEMMKQGAAEGGYDLFEPDENEDNRTASAKGIATASQDSVDENNGRLTSIQGLIFNMDENQKKILECNIANLSQLQKLDNLDHLSVISENTSYCKFLETIDTTLTRMEINGLKMLK